MRFFGVIAVALFFASSQTQGQTPSPVPAAPPWAAQAEDGNWSTPSKNVAGTRFSGLDQINTGNVANLKVAATFSLGVNRGQEGVPLVAGDTLYVIAPYPNILYALDLKQPGFPLKWRYEPQPDSSAQGVACCYTVHRDGAGLPLPCRPIGDRHANSACNASGGTDRPGSL